MPERIRGVHLAMPQPAYNRSVAPAASMAAILEAIGADVRYLPAVPQKRPNGSWFIRLTVESPGMDGLEKQRKLFDLEARTKPEAYKEAEALKQMLMLRAPMAASQFTVNRLLDEFETRHLKTVAGS